MQSSKEDEASLGRIARILTDIRRKGAVLWTKNGALHYKAPKGALCAGDIEMLGQARHEIVAALQRESVESNSNSSPDLKCVEPYQRESRRELPAPKKETPVSCGPSRAPLSYSQLAQWHSYELGELCAARQLASATRLRGRLFIQELRKSISDVVHRHGALRTKITLCDGSPTQEVFESSEYDLHLEDLTALSEASREAEIQRLLGTFMRGPIDVSVDPLFIALLLRLRDDEHVLFLVMEHMISDAYSMNILMRDIFAIYSSRVTGYPLSLPPISTQFAEYALQQQSTENLWAKTHAAYWGKRLAGCERVRFPLATCVSPRAKCGWATVKIRIDEATKRELREWSRVMRTTVVMAVLTAFIGLVLRWCDVSDAVFRYQTDGRASPDVQNTVGYFASVLFLRVTLFDDDTFVDLLRRVIDEYCNACEHADASFIDAQIPRREFARNSGFNWIPSVEQIDLVKLERSQNSIVCSPVPFEESILSSLERDAEPGITLFDTDDGILGDIYFPAGRFCVSTMEKFGREFTVFIRTLVGQPQSAWRTLRSFEIKTSVNVACT